MYGMMPKGKNCQPAQVAAAKQVIKAQQSATLLLEMLSAAVSIDARRGDVRTQAIDRQHGQREQHALAQVRYSKDIRQFLEHLGHLFL